MALFDDVVQRTTTAFRVMIENQAGSFYDEYMELHVDYVHKTALKSILSEGELDDIYARISPNRVPTPAPSPSRKPR